jgi:hypothetical protein
MINVPNNLFYQFGGGFGADFTGRWSNGWYSTGTLTGGVFNYIGVGMATGSVQITTEPSTFMMLGAGLVPMIGVIRRRRLNR